MSLIHQKLKKIESDINERLEKLTSFERRNPQKHFLLNLIFSLNLFDSYFLFGFDNDKLGNVESMLCTLINGLYDDGKLAFSLVNGKYVLNLVPEDSSPVKLVDIEDFKDLVSALNESSEYARDNVDEIYNVLSEDFGKDNHPSTISDLLKENTKVMAYKLGWKPT
jgi:hypothetical protein